MGGMDWKDKWRKNWDAEGKGDRNLIVTLESQVFLRPRKVEEIFVFCI